MSIARKFFASTALASVAPVAGLGLTACGADGQPSDKMSTTQDEKISDKDKIFGNNKVSDKDRTTGKDTMIDKGKPSDKDKMVDRDKPSDKDKAIDGSIKNKRTDGSTKGGSMTDG